MHIQQLSSLEENKIQPCNNYSDVCKNSDQQFNKKKKQIRQTKLFRILSFKHIVNISDLLFINEQTRKCIKNSNENILKAMFRYKAITKIVLNNSYICLYLKKMDENYLPPEYFFERFRSIGDQQITRVADHLQKLYKSLSWVISGFNEQNYKESPEAELKFVDNFVKEMENRKFILYYMNVNKEKVNLKNMFFSLPLLHSLGWSTKKISDDYLKYKHVFFQIFSPRNYKNYIDLCVKNYRKTFDLLKNNRVNQKQLIELTTIYFDDWVIREVETETGIFEEELKVRIKFHCPRAAMCCVQIMDMDQNSVQRVLKRKNTLQLFKEQNNSDIQCLKQLGFESKFTNPGDKEGKQQSEQRLTIYMDQEI